MAEKTNGSTNGATGFARPADVDVDIQDFLSVTEEWTGRRVLVTGTTGFLGKVLISMILRFHPDIEQLYLLIRSRRDATSQERFEELIAHAEALAPIQEALGAGYDAFIEEKITVLDGDLCQPLLGLERERATEISADLDLFINSAGLTNFNPNLRNALEINTLSTVNIINFIRLGDAHAKLLHVSTSYVAGTQSGRIPEVAPGPRTYPGVDELALDYDHRREIADCQKLIDHFEAISHDQEHRATFVQSARQFLKENNLNPDDEDAFERACEQARKKWVKKKLSQEGRERAAFWGWPNIYTYTKSLGERLLVDVSDQIDVTLVRPAVIESSVTYPEVGWNEGINTTAPICFMIYKGHRSIPTRDGVNLDVIPVDHVCGAMIAIGAALFSGEYDDVYHLGSSDLNPVSVARLAELSSLAARRIIDREVKRPGWQKLALKSMAAVPVTKKEFERQSAPGIGRAAQGIRGLLGKLPTKSLGGVGQAIEGVRSGLRGVEKMTKTTEKIFELFFPFIHDNRLTFESSNIKDLAKRLHPAQRPRYGCPIEDLDWRDYWINIHVPGLNRRAFPELEAKLAASQKDVYTYDDLVDLFDASTHNFRRRLAMQHHAGQIVERYTYGEIKERAERAAQTLRGMGLGRGHTALLVSENRPQWGMAYFGILKTGGIAVPVDSEATVDQLLNVIRSAQAHLIIVSDAVAHRLGPDFEEALRERGLPAQMVTLGQLFTLALTDEDAAKTTVDAPASTDDDAHKTSEAVVDELMLAQQQGQPLASLIFTSGTTGEPKGVMLSHQNFTHLLTSLQQTFDIDERDGFLSVLPLHHTFEFACGLLMPLSRGASITYLEELTGEELTAALNNTRITALIGVPALWQLLERRITNRIDEAPPAAKFMLQALSSLNTAMRERLGINLGSTFFGPVHQAFGGRLKHMISGGAALPDKTMETFHGLGFDLYEGYGLTEAAPVLTVNSPKQGLNPGSVGQPLPGIEVDIKDPDDEGVGEIIARGPNVMRGYLGRDEETEKALQDGWLHTGDLGMIDDRGNLTIVGREKEVIVTAGGKNVYPDELEDVYGKCPGVAELSIVGLPDEDGAERVACLVRADLADDADAETRAQTKARIREWFRVEGKRGPAHHRLQVIRFWDDELPRTATRKIKRSEVVDILDRLMIAEQLAIESGDVENTTAQWLDEALVSLSGYDIERIHDGTHILDDMGFDSLMFVELASVLETRGYHLTPEILADVATVGELQALLDEDDQGSTALIRTPKKSTAEQVDAIDVPDPVAQAVKEFLRNGQMAAYDNLFDVSVFGRAHIPHHNPNIIVVANHCSHLDMGLVKYALGDYGRDIRALAAADYFFKNKARKTYFGNFTNLLPIERSGTLENALGGASTALRRGEMLLVFPEGTRSKSGKIQKFQRGLGYLVDTHGVDVLPLWIDGTYRALPKGQPLPSPASRKLNVHIGPLLSASELKNSLGDQSPTERYKSISEAARKAVTDLRDAAQGRDKEPDDESLEPIFDYLSGRFAENSVDSPVSFYFSLGHWDSHKWTITVDPEMCQIQNKKPSGRADCVIKTSPEMFRKIVHESYVPSMDEFMSGDIKTNDPNLLMRFQSVFEL